MQYTGWVSKKYTGLKLAFLWTSFSHEWCDQNEWFLDVSESYYVIISDT
jgi:hypothetical protein